MQDLRHALVDVGFAVLVNAPGLDADFQASCFKEAHAFFSLPHEVKQQYSIDNSPHLRGFASKADGALGEQAKKDTVEIATEAFQLGPDGPAPDRSKVDICDMILRGPNQWPSEVPGLRSSIKELHKRSEKLSRDLGGLICEMLVTQQEKYDAWFRPTEPDFIAAMNYNQGCDVYSPDVQERMREQLNSVKGAGAHIDGAPFITVLFSDQPGLEVLASDGKTWLDVPNVAGGVTINIGGTLSTLSGGRCRATLHRVNPLKIQRPRVSLPFFLLPSLDGELRPFDATARVELPYFPKRNRRLSYAVNRMALFGKAREKWFSKEFEEAQAVLAQELVDLEAARARRDREARQVSKL